MRLIPRDVCHLCITELLAGQTTREHEGRKVHEACPPLIRPPALDDDLSKIPIKK